MENALFLLKCCGKAPASLIVCAAGMGRLLLRYHLYLVVKDTYIEYGDRILDKRCH